MVSFNYESLEFLGDTVLKLLATIEVFYENPSFEEGQLHIERSSYIKNNNLRRVAVKDLIFRYIFSNRFTEHHVGVELQPLSTNSENSAQIQESELENFAKQLPDKTVADALESLIGIFYERYWDLNACQQFLYSLRVLRRPELRIEFAPIGALGVGRLGAGTRSSELANSQKDLPKSWGTSPESGQAESESLLQRSLRTLEKLIGYRFNNISNA